MDAHGGASLTIAPSGVHVDPLTNDSDFTRIQQFVIDRLNASEDSIDGNATIPEAELNR